MDSASHVGRVNRSSRQTTFGKINDFNAPPWPWRYALMAKRFVVRISPFAGDSFSVVGARARALSAGGLAKTNPCDRDCRLLRGKF